jgi:hypothetical protein
VICRPSIGGQCCQGARRADRLPILESHYRFLALAGFFASFHSFAATPGRFALLGSPSDALSGFFRFGHWILHLRD